MAGCDSWLQKRLVRGDCNERFFCEWPTIKRVGLRLDTWRVRELIVESDGRGVV